MNDIAFLGLGRMGSLMARRLVGAGHRVTVWNRTPARTAPLVAAGAVAARTPAEAAAARDLVITMLRDPAAVQAVVAAADLTGETTLVEMSTIGPTAVARLRAALPDSVRLVDAPVLGTLPQARGGDLGILAGGAADDIARVTPVLDVLGNVRHVGPLGTAAATKLVVNAGMIASMTVLSEVVTLGSELDLDTTAVLDALSAGPLGGLVERIRRRLDDPHAGTQFAYGLAHKDLELALAESGRRSALRSGVLEAARERLASGVEDGLADADLTAVVRFPARA
ncbi:MAG TPA: NAD(P)-dependent oxidoreductase [Actinopolymorphaceae bacterium]